MVFVLLALWTLAAILIITNPKREPTRWVALTCFTAGGGGLSRTMTETVIPYLHNFHISTSSLDKFLFTLHEIGSFMNHAGMPYCFLMFAITYSGLFRERTKKICAYILPLPIPIMFWVTPFVPDIDPDFKVYFSWCVPYLLTGIFLLLYSTRKEKNKFVKRDRVYTNILSIPPILFQIIVNYTIKAFFSELPEVWRYMPFVIAMVFIFFLIFGTKYGIYGVGLRFEKKSLDNTMRAMTTGTSIINHTIKTEIGKIKIMADWIKSVAESENQMEIKEQVKSIMESTEHLTAMVSRIRNQLRDIKLEEKLTNMETIISSSLSLVRPYLERKKISVVVDSKGELMLSCDEVLLQEVLINLFNNAIEAMDEGGLLYISLYETKKHIIVEVMDNGIGIRPEHLSHVMEPFYSTKNQSDNFGLGLSFCYNVMQKHQGALEIQSEKNAGTTAVLYFPKKKRDRRMISSIKEEIGIG